MSRYYLFLDESGDHSLTKIDPQYPLFVLGGALLLADAYPAVEERWKESKRRAFGDENIPLHTADLARNRNGFERMQNPLFRERVFAELNEAMSDTPLTALGCAVHKSGHLARYGLAAVDPYHLALKILVERAYFAMGRTGKLHIIAESRNPNLDRTLEIVFLELKVRGTEYLSAAEINRLEPELHIRAKTQNIIGLQLADLIVSPLGRHVLGKTPHEDWHVVREKLYRYRGKWEGAGLVVLPE